MPVWHVARAPEGALFIGRPSRFANWSKAATREERIADFRRDLWARIETGDVTVEELAALDGADFACYCKPRSCHGDVLEAAVAWAVRLLSG